MWIPIVIAIVTVISTFYYIRIIQIIYFEEEKETYGLTTIPEGAGFILYGILAMNILYLLVTSELCAMTQYFTLALYV